MRLNMTRPSWSGYNNLSSHNEARIDLVLFLCDNGKIVIITQ